MSEIKDAMKIVKMYGDRRYEEGKRDAGFKAKSVKACIEYAYNEGKCDAEREALKMEKQLEEDVNRLKEIIHILRKSNAEMAKKIETLERLSNV